MKKILIAEDEEVYLRALSLVLRKAGYEVDTATNGADAIDALKNKQYDLFFTDLMMPKINGFEILSTMREQNITTPTIVLSNLSQATDEKKARDLGAIDFLLKSNVKIAEVLALAQRRLS